jgi:hypothetical protein
MKIVILDSGPLINLSLNGMLYIFEELKKNFDGKFIITPYIKYETIDHPLEIKRFELGALRVKDLLDRKVIELPDSIGLDEKEISVKTEEITNTANHIVKVKDKFVSLVSEAEMSCLAVSDLLKEKKIESIIAIDERTTRILSEKTENLERIMAEKLHQRVMVDMINLEKFSHYRFIRSPELVYVAYKKGLLKPNVKKVLEAALYATKFSGSSISFEEIEELKRL